ncbi:hypothetical protein STEG23_017792 [Scotinomys teguina]
MIDSSLTGEDMLRVPAAHCSDSVASALVPTPAVWFEHSRIPALVQPPRCITVQTSDPVLFLYMELPLQFSVHLVTPGLIPHAMDPSDGRDWFSIPHCSVVDDPLTLPMPKAHLSKNLRLHYTYQKERCQCHRTKMTQQHWVQEAREDVKGNQPDAGRESIVICPLVMGRHSEKCISGQFYHYVNITEHTHTTNVAPVSQGSTVYGGC